MLPTRSQFSSGQMKTDGVGTILRALWTRGWAMCPDRSSHVPQVPLADFSQSVTFPRDGFLSENSLRKT